MTDRDEAFFIGWSKTPAIDRRFLLRASLGLLAASGVGAALLGGSLSPAGGGTWDMSQVRAFPGHLVRKPYPMLRTSALTGEPRTVFLVGSGKTGLQGRLEQRADGPVVIRGSLIQRGNHAMIAVEDDEGAIASASGPADSRLIGWSEQDLGEVLLTGEVLDAKCWFGAMRPGAGHVHKACAALCIRGGLPPAFCASGSACGDSSDAPLLLRADGGVHGDDLLSLVADPVHAVGRLVRVGDVMQFRADMVGFKRL